MTRNLVSGVVGALFIVMGCMVFAAFSPEKTKYVTWESLEPDKWASVWLIKTSIDPRAIIEVRATGTSLEDGIAFGAPGARYRRTADKATFESLLETVEDPDPALVRMGQLISRIETTSWQLGNDPYVSAVEQNFRRLQDKYSRAYVPVNCYALFFETLHRNLKGQLSPKQMNSELAQAVDNTSCESGPRLVKRQRDGRVTELPIEQLLAEVASGKHVVFVDTREPAEYEKSHIPGAINVPMRDLDAAVYDRLKQADRVISYCVKDFRGYEVARLMRENGVDGVAVMNPYGLSGWNTLNLPTASGSDTDSLKIEQLKQCAKDWQACIKTPS